jgi:hypothetical protein
MSQQPNTIQIMLIYAQLCATYLLYIMLHSKKTFAIYYAIIIPKQCYTCQILGFHSQKKIYTFTFWIPTLKILGPPLGPGNGLRAGSVSKKWQNDTVAIFVVIWQIVSNYGLIRLKRFILSISSKLCN